MTNTPRANLWICITLLTGLIGLATAVHAADDTARFYGTWEAHILVNGQVVDVISMHDANGYKNYVRTATGDTPSGEGTFSAANGRYKTSAESPNNGGVYYFSNNDTAVCTNWAGQIVTWRRIKTADGSAVAKTSPADPTAAPPAQPPPAGKH
jgi:hypothetical protein